MHFRVYDYTGKNGREANQDCLAVEISNMGENEKMAHLIVADGMGGLEKGDYLSRYAINAYRARFSELMQIMSEQSLPLKTSYIRQSMEDSMFYAQEKVMDTISKEEVHGGTTMTCLAVRNNVLSLINAGDSPCYLFRADRQEVTMLTVLENKGYREYQRGTISSRKSDEYLYASSFLYNFIGCDRFRLGEATQLHVFPGDVILAGSDGAFGDLVEEDICQFLLEYDPEEAMYKIMEEARRRGETDNQTMIVLEMQGEKTDA